jgi:hypothetical protein
MNDMRTIMKAPYYVSEEPWNFKVGSESGMAVVLALTVQTAMDAMNKANDYNELDFVRARVLSIKEG